VRYQPQQRHKQALHYGSAPPFTFLCIPLHGSSVYHSSNPPFVGTKCLPLQFKKCHCHDKKFNPCSIFVQSFTSNVFEPSESGNISPTKRIRQHFSSHQNQNQTRFLEPSESFNEVQVYFQMSQLLYFPFGVGLTKKTTWGVGPCKPHAPYGVAVSNDRRRCDHASQRNSGEQELRKSEAPIFKTKYCHNTALTL